MHHLPLLLSSAHTLETAIAEKVHRMQKCDDEADMQIGVASVGRSEVKWSKRAFNGGREASCQPRELLTLAPRPHGIISHDSSKELGDKM